MHDNVLQAFNGCLRRPDGDKRYLIWNGAHNHPEIGSAFVGYLHAFIEALVGNRRLVLNQTSLLSTHSPPDVVRQRQLVDMFGVRLPWAPDICGTDGNCSEAGWPISAAKWRYTDRLPAIQLKCLKEVMQCSMPPLQRTYSHKLCCDDEIMRCVAPSAYTSLINSAAAPSTLAWKTANSLRSIYSHPLDLDTMLADNARKFEAAVHLRLILPGIDHIDDRHKSTCARETAKFWLRTSCAHETHRNILERLGNLASGAAVFILSDSIDVTISVVQYLRSHSINAQAFVRAHDLERSSDYLDWVEWWLLARSRRILYAGHSDMQNRPSQFSVRAADAGNATYEPIQNRCSNTHGCRLCDKYNR